jgi:hypothetical protein
MHINTRDATKVHKGEKKVKLSLCLAKQYAIKTYGGLDV